MTAEQQALVDEIKRVCMANYERGGDEVIECFTDEEILKEFKSVADAKDYCSCRVETALNQRWGEDDDPQVALAERHDKWEDNP